MRRKKKERNLIERVQILTNTTNQLIDRYQATEFHSTCSLATRYHMIMYTNSTKPCKLSAIIYKIQLHSIVRCKKKHVIAENENKDTVKRD